MIKEFICLVISDSISNQKVLLKGFLTKNERIWTRISSNWQMSPRLSKHWSTTRGKFPGFHAKDFEMRNDNPLWQNSRFSPFLSLQKEEYCVRFRWYPTTSPAFEEIILQSIACWWVGCVCVCKQSPLQRARIVMIMGLNPSIVKNCMSRIIWQNGR